MTISQNTAAHNVTRKELSRRGDLLARLSDEVERVQETVRTGARRRAEVAEPSWRENGHGRNGGDSHSSGRQGAYCAQQELQEQDEALDFLHGTVQNLKTMGGDISQEIDLHCKLLGELEDQTDNSTAKARQQRMRLGEIGEQGTSCALWACICVLISVLFVLLVFF